MSCHIELEVRSNDSVLGILVELLQKESLILVHLVAANAALHGADIIIRLEQIFGIVQ